MHPKHSHNLKTLRSLAKRKKKSARTKSAISKRVRYAQTQIEKLRAFADFIEDSGIAAYCLELANELELKLAEAQQGAHA